MPPNSGVTPRASAATVVCDRSSPPRATSPPRLSCGGRAPRTPPAAAIMVAQHCGAVRRTHGIAAAARGLCPLASPLGGLAAPGPPLVPPSRNGRRAARSPGFSSGITERRCCPGTPSAAWGPPPHTAGNGTGKQRPHRSDNECSGRAPGPPTRCKPIRMCGLRCAPPAARNRRAAGGAVTSIARTPPGPPSNRGGTRPAASRLPFLLGVQQHQLSGPRAAPAAAVTGAGPRAVVAFVPASPRRLRRGCPALQVLCRSCERMHARV